MGGKTWSFEEERFFWLDIVPQSPKAINPEGRILNWDQCAKRMQEAMGDQARRRYTKLMLFEHYFQNFCTGHLSPHALVFVNEHKRQNAAAAAAAAAEYDGQSTTAFNEAAVQPKAGSITTEQPATEAADVIPFPSAAIPPVNGRALASHKQLPRLEIPALQPPQVSGPYSDSSPGSESYHPSAPLEYPGYLAYPPRYALPSAYSYGYESPVDYSVYDFGRNSIGTMMSSEPSPALSHYTSAASPVPPPIGAVPTSSGIKRKLEYTPEPELYPIPPKRLVLPSQTIPLDTLAAAASLNYVANQAGTPANPGANDPVSMLSTAAAYVSSGRQSTLCRRGEMSSVAGSQAPNLQPPTAPVFGDWTI